MVFDHVFYELSILLLFAGAVAFVGLQLKQPLIVSFIAAGIFVGPSFLGLVHSFEHLELLAEFGVAVLLFVVGLKLDPHLIRTTGPVALATGLGQVLFTSVIGYFICVALGMEPITALYVAVALTFSSTIIIVKLLSDKGEVDALHGRVALGLLIVQDMVVVVVMIGLSAFGLGTASEDGMVMTLALVLLKGIALLAFIALFMKYLAQRVLERLSHSQELMVLLAVGWAVALASLSDAMGFSSEMGAFLAGISLASTSFRDVIGSRLTSLRDFLLLFFFIGMGAHMDLSTVGSQIIPAVVLSLFVLIGNPIIVMIIMATMGYRKRTGFLAGLTVAQISEFSLIFAALGLGLGHITGETMGLVTLVGVITIGTSTYMILYSQQLYKKLEWLLWPFERKNAYRETTGEGAPEQHVDVIVFGLGRYGSNIARGLRQQGLSVLGIDFSPDAVRQWQAQGHPAIYGDATDPDFPHALPLHQAKWVISAVPSHFNALTDSDTALTLLRGLKANGYAGRVAVTSHRPGDVGRYKEAGADLVLLPFSDAARQAVEQISHFGEARATLETHPAPLHSPEESSEAPPQELPDHGRPA